MEKPEPKHIEVADRAPEPQRVSEEALVIVDEKIQDSPERRQKKAVEKTPANTPEKTLEKKVTEWISEEPEKAAISEVELPEKVSHTQKAEKQKIPGRDKESYRIAEKPTATPHEILVKEAEEIPQSRPQGEVKGATPKGTSESQLTSLLASLYVQHGQLSNMLQSTV